MAGKECAYPKRVGATPKPQQTPGATQKPQSGKMSWKGSSK